MTFGILALGFPVSTFCRFRSLWGLTVSLSSLFFPILMHSLGDVWHPGSGVPCFEGFGSFAPILMHSLGDVWHPGSGVPCFEGFRGFATFGGSQSHFFPILPYLNAFLRFGILALGFLVSEVLEVSQPLGAQSLTFFLIFPYLNAFLRWRLASWLWGSLFRRFWRIRSLWGLTVSLSSLFFPILMHSLGDVWHPGSGVPCFGSFAGFAAFGGSQSHFLPYSSLS